MNRYALNLQTPHPARKLLSDIMLADFDLLTSLCLARLIVWRQLWRERMNGLMAGRKLDLVTLNSETTRAGRLNPSRREIRNG